MRSAATPLLPLLLSLALPACVSTPSPPPGTTDYRIADGYDGLRPADVAVLPVEGGGISPEASAAVRDALRARLLARRYAPVRNREVDGRPGEFRPGGPNAVLEVKVIHWGDARIWGDGSVLVSAEGRLLAPGSGAVLYGATVDAVRVRADRVARSLEERRDTLEGVAAELAELLLARLPMKGDG